MARIDLRILSISQRRMWLRLSDIVDSDIRFGFVLTDHELVLCQIIKDRSYNESRPTRELQLVLSSTAQFLPDTGR